MSAADVIPAAEVVDRALRAARADETIVLVTDAYDTSLRWAGNSMTTNGSSVSRDWAVVSIYRDGPRSARVGSVASTSVDPADIEGVGGARATGAGPPPPPPPPPVRLEGHDRGGGAGP
ncbi:hypothetical protein [Nocardia wallacei]|uniref:hypothetical protein n=1 Tax=Nocardia wallacei TaxID=480035 RepID=UPI003CC80237